MHVMPRVSDGLLCFITDQITFRLHVMQCPVLFRCITDSTILSDKTEHHDLGIIKVKGHTVSQLLHRPSGWRSTLPVCPGRRITCHNGSQTVYLSLV